MSHRRILITGANKGIGHALVSAVLEAADDTAVLLGSRDLGRGEAARQALVDANPAWSDRIKVLQIDVSDDDSVRQAAASVADKFGSNGSLYAIVNNAGVGLGSGKIGPVVEINTYGPHRVVEAFMPMLDPANGRIVNISSASGPSFVATCSAERQAFLTNPGVTWDDVDRFVKECLEVEAADGDFESRGLGDGGGYGISKACLNAYTIHLARENPNLVINACTPGFIETDLTRPYADGRGVAPADLGMKPPEQGTKSALHLLFGDVGGNGWYFGSDAVRSPLDRYRSPGDPPYTGD